MLEILYETAKKRVRGWCADPDQFGNFTPKPDEAVVVWDIPIPPRADWHEVDLVNEVVISKFKKKVKTELPVRQSKGGSKR